jgi:gliding motility-associated-like protein
MPHKIAHTKILKSITVLATVILMVFFFSFKGNAQSLGDPIINITFGSGVSKLAGPLAADSGSTTYTYSSAMFPNDGSYSIMNTTANTNTGWYTTTDHTGNPGGYMMIVNASFEPGVFYTRTVQGLCGGTTYQFAAWIKNLLNYAGILPNVTFSIETTNGTLLGSGSTNNIPMGNTWVQYPFTFTTPANVGNIVIKMTNNAPGGIGNDIAIDDITFRPYGAPVAVVFDQLATTQSFCQGTSQKLNINSTVSLPSGYLQKLQELINGVWTDQSAAVTTSSFTINTSPLAGIYYYRIVTGQANNISSSKCVIASNQLTVTVFASPIALFSVADTACLGTSSVFKDKSTTANGAIAAWLWDFGDGTTATTQNPSHTYKTAGNYTVKLIVTNSNGCASSAASQSLHIGALPVAAFSYSTPDCVTNAITFTDGSTNTDGNIVSWVWNYGDGITETKTTNTAFQHTFTTTGAFQVSLMVTNNFGCSSTLIQNITIKPLPIVNFGTPAVCLADASALFTDSTTIADNSKLTYLWDFGDVKATNANPNTSSLQNPSHKYTQAKIYQVSLTVTSNNGCIVNKTKGFTVNGSIPAAAFTVLNPLELCSNREVFLVNNSTVDFGNITKIEMYYDYGNNPTVIEIDNSPYVGKLYRHTYATFHITPASKNYQVRMVAYSGGTCVAETSQAITLLAAPNLVFTAPAAVCKNDLPVQIAAKESSGIAGSGIYTGAGINASGVFNPATTGVGTFAINYIYTANNACADTISQNITVNPSPTAYAGADTTVLEGGSITLHAKASGDSLTYSWSPSIYLSNSSVLDPIITPANDIIYTLTVTTIKGCTASSSIKVTVLKSPVIPNTFTPNGDGINDTWVIKHLESYAGATVEVFNRYGRKVYSSIGYPVPWDGRFNNTEVAAGVYYYLINPKHGRKAFSGWVNIIR